MFKLVLIFQITKTQRRLQRLKKSVYPAAQTCTLWIFWRLQRDTNVFHESCQSTTLSSVFTKHVGQDIDTQRNGTGKKVVQTKPAELLST